MTLRSFQWGLWVAPLVLVGVLGFTHRWTSDDGFAYFRVVDQILDGNGPVFNAGQRVETFASPLWVAALTVGDLVTPFELAYVAVALSIAATLLGLSLATAASARLMDEGGALLLPLGLVVIAVLWPTWIWSTGGEELGLVLAWIGASAWILARWASRSDADPNAAVGRLGLVLLGLGPLVRPDLTLPSAVLVLAVVMGTAAPTRRRASMLLTAGALPLGYQIFRMGYYGLITSSWSLGREDTATRPGFGWEYFADFTSTYLLLVPLVAVLLAVYIPFVQRNAEAGRRRRIAALVAIAGSGVLNVVVIIVIVGGDSVHARALLPSMVMMLTPAFVVPVARRHIAAIVAVAVWAVGCGVFMRPGNVPALSLTGAYPGRRLTLADAGFGDAAGWIDGPGLYLADPFEPTGTKLPIKLADPDAVVVASRSIGLTGYSLGTDVDILDLNGIADPFTGHQGLEFRYLPGQEKSAYAPWLVARFAETPDQVLPTDLPDERPFHDPVAPLLYLEQVAWAQATLECGPFERLADAYDAPLTFGGFARNVWRAMSNTSLRFPADPRRAYSEEGCGEASPLERLTMRGPVPETVERFYARVETGPVLPADPESGSVAVAGRCDVTLVATEEDDLPWTPVRAGSFRATVTFDESVTPEPLTAVWALGPFGPDRGVVWLQTDGSGNYRVVQEINWIPQVASPWMPIDPAAPVELAVSADLDENQWVLTVDGAYVAHSPMLSESAAGGVSAAVPQRAAPGHTSSSPLIAHEGRTPDRTCQAVLVANAEPGPVGVPQYGVPRPSAT